MERFDRAALASVILNAPAWARIGLTVRDEKTRERAADALAATIVERLEEPNSDFDSRQIALPF